MGLKKYFVNTDGASNQGPYELALIIEMIRKKQLKATDKLYLADSDKWIMISEHPEYTDMPTEQQVIKQVEKPKLSTPAMKFKEVQSEAVMDLQQPLSPDAQWFLLRNGKKQGPYSYQDILKMLQQKLVFEYEHAWKQGMENWERLAEIPHFSSDQIRQLQKTKEAKKEEIFNRRNTHRMPYKCEIVTHNNKMFWAGYTIELSEGGASAVIQNAMLMPGQSIYVHFRPGDQTQSFNVLCEVVSKKYVKNLKDRNTPLIYGIKFINIPKQEKDLIKSMIADAA